MLIFNGKIWYLILLTILKVLKTNSFAYPQKLLENYRLGRALEFFRIHPYFKQYVQRKQGKYEISMNQYRLRNT